MPPDMLTYRFFAKTYGYTPVQVDELGVAALTWFPLIEEAENHAAEVRAKQQARQSRHGR